MSPGPTGAARPVSPVREALTRLSGDSLVYGLGAVGGRAVQLLLVPILTRAIAPDAFGVAELVTAYSQSAILALVCGMDGALARFFHHEPDREARIRMASSSLVFRLATSLAVALIAWFAAGPIATHLIGSGVYAKYIRIGAVTLPFTLFVLFANDVLRVTFQPWKFITLNIAQTLLVGGLSVVLVVARGLGVAGMLYGRLFGDALCALLALVLIRHSIRPRFSRGALARMLAYGAPAVPAILAFGTITAMDRFFLQKFRGLEEVGVYAIAVKFFAVVSIGVSAFQMAYGPFAYARARDPEAPRVFARVFAAFVGGASLIALGVSLFAPEAVHLLVPAAYRGASAPAAWLAFAAVALGAYTVASVGIGLALRTPLLVWCAAGGALAALLGNLVLVPRWGAFGSGAATCSGYVAAASLTYLAAQRVHPFPYRGARLAALFALALGAALVAQRWCPPGAAGIAIKVGVLGLYAALCTQLGIWKERGAVAAHARVG